MDQAETAGAFWNCYQTSSESIIEYSNRLERRYRQMINSINWQEQEFRLVLQFVSGLYHGPVYQHMVDWFNDLTMKGKPEKWPVRKNVTYGAALHKAIGIEKMYPRAHAVEGTKTYY